MAVATWAMALALTAAAPSGDAKAGIDAWQRGDYAGAVAIWQPLAAKGDADAAFDLAQAYNQGRGVTADPAAAEKLYRQAAERGHAQAQEHLAIALYRSGRRGEAIPWFQKAAAQDQPRAELILGSMIFNGDVGKRNLPRAYALVTRAAEQGAPKAEETRARIEASLDDDAKRRGLAMAHQIAGGNAPVATPPPRQVAAARRPSRPREPTAKPAQPAVASNGGWRLQLGAFRVDQRAHALWDRLAKLPALRELRPAYKVSDGITHLQAGTLNSSTQATRACAAVQAAGGNCLPLAP